MASTVSKRHRKETPTVPAQVNGQAASESSDDYLKAILELSGPEDRQVASTDVAVHLKINRASVTKNASEAVIRDAAIDHLRKTSWRGLNEPQRRVIHLFSSRGYSFARDSRAKW